MESPKTISVYIYFRKERIDALKAALVESHNMSESYIAEACALKGKDLKDRIKEDLKDRIKEDWKVFKRVNKETVKKWEIEHKKSMDEYEKNMNIYNEKHGIDTKPKPKSKSKTKKKINAFNLFRREKKSKRCVYCTSKSRLVRIIRREKGSMEGKSK